MIFRNNCLISHFFLQYHTQQNLWRNVASNTASAKRSRYSNRAVTYITVTALLEYLDLETYFMLASSYSCRRLHYLLTCYSGGTATSHFCCNWQPLPRVFLQCTLLLLQYKEYSLLWIQDSLNSKDYHYNTEKLQ